MPRKRKTAPNDLAPKRRHEESYGVEFINIHLTPDDVLHLREWDVEPLEMFLEIERWTGNGYKVSLSVDMENTGGICAITGKRGCNPPENEGRCLVSRGPDVQGAVLSTMYKLQAYCLDGVFPLTQSDGHPDFS